MKSFKRSSLITTAFLFMGISLVTPVLPTNSAQARSARTCNTQWVSAHRGYPTKRATENTLGSFREAIRSGAKAVELDLRVTKDGKWVLMHDATVNRTTRGSGAVNKLTLKQIQAKRANSGHVVPSFDQFVYAMPKGMRYQIEIKVDARESRLQYVVDKMRRKTTDPNRVFFTSHIRSVHKKLAKIAPEYDRGLIMVNNDRIAVKDIPSYITSVNMLHTVATPSYIRDAHKRGKHVLVRGAESPSAWRRAISINADRIVTDNIHNYNKWCRSVR